MRWIRWTIHGLGALSLLVFAAAISLFVRGFWIGDTASWGSGPNLRVVASGKGSLYFMHLAYRPTIEIAWPDLSLNISNDVDKDFAKLFDPSPEASVRTATVERRWTGPGFIFERIRTVRAVTAADSLRISYGWILPLTAAAPAWWFFWYLPRCRRLKRMAEGLCAKCGYDLRASVERCPECGMVIGKKSGVGTATNRD